jgi:hypothetical protein
MLRYSVTEWVFLTCYPYERDRLASSEYEDALDSGLRLDSPSASWIS